MVLAADDQDPVLQGDALRQQPSILRQGLVLPALEERKRIIGEACCRQQRVRSRQKPCRLGREARFGRVGPGRAGKNEKAWDQCTAPAAAKGAACE